MCFQGAAVTSRVKSQDGQHARSWSNLIQISHDPLPPLAKAGKEIATGDSQVIIKILKLSDEEVA